MMVLIKQKYERSHLLDSHDQNDTLRDIPHYANFVFNSVCMLYVKMTSFFRIQDS